MLMLWQVGIQDNPLSINQETIIANNDISQGSAIIVTENYPIKTITTTAILKATN